MKIFREQAGISIIGILLLAVVLILVLSYYNISIKAVVESPTGQENIQYVGGGARNLWTVYLAGPVSYLWNDVWLNIFWKGFINNMEKVRDGQPTDFDSASKNLQVEQGNNDQ